MNAIFNILPFLVFLALLWFTYINISYGIIVHRTTKDDHTLTSCLSDYGIILAFKKYRVSLGIWKSPWAENHGLNNFIRFFNNYNFKYYCQQFRRSICTIKHPYYCNISCQYFITTDYLRRSSTNDDW